MSRTHLATVLIASAAGAVAGAVATSLVSQCALESTSAAPGDEARIVALQREHDALAKSIAELKSGQDLLASRPDRAPALPAPSPRDATEAAASGASAEVAAPLPDGAAQGAPAEVAPTVDSLLAGLLDPNTSYGESQVLWEQANKAGLLSQVVAALEQRAEREPNNPDLRVAVGNAYLQELFAASQMSKGKWAMKADKAFDQALELDSNHWEARFTKAVSLSNWPAFLGKQGAAIAEFETLISQQNAVPKEEHHAQTYLYLGNMYLASGSKAKALEAWQQGAALFPENQALQQQIAQNPE